MREKRKRGKQNRRFMNLLKKCPCKHCAFEQPYQMIKASPNK
jgi:hypothetical protein